MSGGGGGGSEILKAGKWKVKRDRPPVWDFPEAEGAGICLFLLPFATRGSPREDVTKGVQSRVVPVTILQLRRRREGEEAS